jgi:hypothetical protein
MSKKYELDDHQASRLKRGLKVHVLKVGRLSSYESKDEWIAGGEMVNIVVAKEGESANKQKELSLSAVEEVWHRSKQTVFVDGQEYKVRYE